MQCRHAVRVPKQAQRKILFELEECDSGSCLFSLPRRRPFLYPRFFLLLSTLMFGAKKVDFIGIEWK